MPNQIWPNEPAFWTTDSVARLIYEKFNVEHKVEDFVNILLKKSSLTLHKLEKVSVQRDEKEAFEFLHSRIFKYNFVGIHSLL